MQMASSGRKDAGGLRRAAARLAAWSRGRWARIAPGLGPVAGRAARRAALPLLFAAGVGLGLALSRPWGPVALPGFGGAPQAAVAPSRLEGEVAGTAALVTGEPGARSDGTPARTAGASTAASGAGARAAFLSGGLVWPADGMVVAMAGWRRHPEQGDWRYLPGLELAVPSQAPVRAVAAGTVSSVEAASDGFTVVVDHGNGWSTVYGRLSRVTVEPGQALEAGAVLGHAPALPEAVPALAGVYGVEGAGAPPEPAAAVRGVVSFAIYHGTESVDPLSVMPAASFRVADDSPAAGTQPQALELPGVGGVSTAGP